MMPAVVLQIAAYGEEFLARVDREYGLIRAVAKDPLALVPAEARLYIRALLTMGTVGATAELITALPNLGLICCFGSGYEKVDVAAARARGILVTHSPGANASSVADMAVTLLLASIRQVRPLHAFVADGQWQDLKAGRPPTVRGVTGRRIGIVGLGDIGCKIATRLAAFETQVRYHNRTPRAGVPFAHEATLLGLARWADALVIACRAEASNAKLIDAEVLAALGPDGHIVNISRGSVIDEQALIAALRDGTIAGAGLDVFANEPVVPETLRRLPNVVLSPHRAGGTIEAFAAMHAMVAANVDAYFRDRRVLDPVPQIRLS